MGFDDASFPTPEVGYVVDAAQRIFKTEDGGQHWRLLPGIRGQDVSFATPAVGYAVGMGTLYRTEDGGQTWRPTLVPLADAITTTWPALLLPYPGVTDPAQLLEPVLAWYRQTCGAGQPPAPCTVTQIAHTIVPISESAAHAHSQNHILLTEDGGYHWALLGQTWNRFLSDTARVDAMLWYAGTGLGEVYRSRDGGAAWHLRGSIQGAASLVAFPTAEVGFATGPISQPQAPKGYGLHKTEDGGATWRRLPVEVPGFASCLVFVSEKRGFVAGERGILMRTIDGGETWTRASLPVKPLFERLLFSTPTVGYAVGSRSTILKTTDGGESWTVLTHGSERFEKGFER